MRISPSGLRQDKDINERKTIVSELSGGENAVNIFSGLDGFILRVTDGQTTDQNCCSIHRSRIL